MEPGDRVIAKYGVSYNGKDLSNEIGIIQNKTSYIIVFFPKYDVEVKMLAYELDQYPAYDSEDYIDWS